MFKRGKTWLLNYSYEDLVLHVNHCLAQPKNQIGARFLNVHMEGPTLEGWNKRAWIVAGETYYCQNKTRVWNLKWFR